MTSRLKTITILSLIFAVLCSAASAYYFDNATIEPSSLYPEYKNQDSTYIHGKGLPFAIWASNNNPIYGPPKSGILWEGVFNNLVLYFLIVFIPSFLFSVVLPSTAKKTADNK